MKPFGIQFLPQRMNEMAETFGDKKIEKKPRSKGKKGC